jgi:hypothetical protein
LYTPRFPKKKEGRWKKEKKIGKDSGDKHLTLLLWHEKFNFTG